MTRSPGRSTQSGCQKRDFLWLAVLMTILFGFMLGSRPLDAPDEARYSEIPREMVVSGNYLTPHLDGVKYFEKPALFYWMQATSIRLFGLSEWSMRTWTAIFGLLGVLAVYGAGATLWGRRAGWAAAGVLATSILYYGLSRTVTLDMAVSTWLTLGLLAFMLGVRHPPGPQRRRWLYIFYVLAALATLTKGLIGIVLPGMIIGAWIALLGRWRELRALYLPSGLLLFLAVAAPWHVLVARANPGFAWFYFIHEHFERYLTTVAHRFEPWWYFIPILLVGLLPWTAFLFQALRHALRGAWRDRDAHAEVWFLVLWAGLIFAFFSGSDSKLIPYVLPVVPPLALIIGRYLALAPKEAGIRTGFRAALALSLVVAIGFIIAPRFWHAAGVAALYPYLITMAAAMVIAAIVALILARRGRPGQAVISLAVGSALMLSVLSAGLPLLPMRSVKDLALVIRSQLQPGDEVVSYHTYYQDLPFYLRHTVGTVAWRGELKFGSTLENVSNRLMGEADFWQRWTGPQTIYMVLSRQSLEQLRAEGRPDLFVIAASHDNVVLCNKNK